MKLISSCILIALSLLMSAPSTLAKNTLRSSGRALTGGGGPELKQVPFNVLLDNYESEEILDYEPFKVEATCDDSSHREKLTIDLTIENDYHTDLVCIFFFLNEKGAITLAPHRKEVVTIFDSNNEKVDIDVNQGAVQCTTADGYKTYYLGVDGESMIGTDLSDIPHIDCAVTGILNLIEEEH